MPIITENGIDPFAPIEGVASNEWAHLILGPPGMQPPGPGLDLMDVPLTTAGDGRAEMKPARGHRRAAEPRRAAVKLEDMDRDDPFKGQFDDDDDELGDDGTGRGNLNRGKYRCGRCGQYKVNHQCPFIIDRSCRTVGAQARPRARFSCLSLSLSLAVCFAPSRNATSGVLLPVSGGPEAARHVDWIDDTLSFEKCTTRLASARFIWALARTPSERSTTPRSGRSAELRWGVRSR